MGASVQSFEGLVDPEILEAKACSEALALAADLNLSRVIVFTDCQATINHLRNIFHGTSSMIIEEIKMKLIASPDVEIVHEGREGNFEAATTLPVGHLVWFLNTPDIICIDDIVEF